MIKTIVQFIFVCGLFLFSGSAIAQDVQIELGASEIGLNETFTIKITLSNEKIKSYDQFPDIPSFQKQGISQSSSMNLINGQMSSSNSIIQYYKPSKRGEFTLPAFEVMINGQPHSSPGIKIKVGDPSSAGATGGQVIDPF